MSTKKQRRLDRKRKAKQGRKHRLNNQESLAYKGNKYKTDELIPVLFNTETAIYEAFVIADRQITDHDVCRALEKLILGIRRGRIQPRGDAEGDDHIEAEGFGGLIVSNIRYHWRFFFQTEPYPGRDKMVGVLRTTLSSIDIWGSVSPKSRGYLEYIEEFLAEAGVSVEEISPDTMIQRVDEDLEEDFEEDLEADLEARLEEQPEEAMVVGPVREKKRSSLMDWLFRWWR